MLRATGLISQAEALEDALYGSTSGEILADLGSRAQAVLRSELGLPSDVRGRLATLLRDVDRVLRDAGRI